MFGRRHHTADSGKNSARPVVILAEANTSVEHQLIRDWLASGNLENEVPETSGLATQYVPAEPEEVIAALTRRTDDPLVVPARILWLPAERDGVRRARVADLVTLTNPRNPNRLAQRWIVKHADDRHRVLIGEPARLSQMRSRHQASTRSSSAMLFARYVIRSAVVTLERAERKIIGDRYKVPRMVVEEILDNLTFRATLGEIGAAQGLTESEVLERAETALRELVAVQSRLVTDLFTQAMGPLHKHAWKVHADESGIADLRRKNRHVSLVFLPSHRSYADPLVLGDVLAAHEFPPNHLVGGANLNFWPMGSIARRSGAIFIRRSFGDDEVYKAVVQEYFAYLLAKRFNLEWYFEGGRTRTGKLRPPKYGLLNYLANAIRSGRSEDALLVPVSITYERLNELGAISAEQLGAKKKPEGLAWMAKYVMNQQMSAGQVYIRFGEPFSARERLQLHGDPLDLELAEEPAARRAVQKLAFDVAVRINNVTPITANALSTFTLLGVEGRALTVPEIDAVIAPVLKYVQLRGIPMGTVERLQNLTGLTLVLDQLVEAKVATVYRGGTESVYAIERGQHLVAAFYRNSAVHWFVNRALVELTIIGDDSTDGGKWTRAHEVRDLLKFEFFFPDREVLEEELDAELALLGDLGSSAGGAAEALRATGFTVAHRVLRSFVDAQLVVAERLAAHRVDTEVDTKLFLAECVAVGQQMLLQGRVHSPESVSSELFTSALKLATNRGLVLPGDGEVAARRAAFAAELRKLEVDITTIAELDPSSRGAS